MSNSADLKSLNLICTRSLELGIVLDSSNSLSNDDFKDAKDFLVNFLRSFDIGPNEARVALVMYGNDVDRASAIKLAEYNDKNSLINAVRNLDRIYGNTSTGLAITYMHKRLMKDSFVRYGVPKNIVVITDGNSQSQRKTNQSASEARDDQFNVFAVGVGNDISQTELVGIAGDENRVFTVDNYRSLKYIIRKLAKVTCEVKPPPPKKPCACNE